MKFFLTLLLLIYGQTVESKMISLDPKQKLLWKSIQEEVSTIVAVGDLGPRLRHRVLELYTEKLKLIKEVENQKLLNADQLIRKEKGKAHYFKGSLKLYNKIRTYGFKSLKRFPQFNKNADIYHTLALNSRDFGDGKETEKFLLKSLHLLRPSSDIRDKVYVSLAEYYYNQKKYPKAIHYYKTVLKQKNDPWYTKHLYNSSWCYLKLQNYKLAVANLLEAFNLSKKEPYISFEDQVYQSIGPFYILAGTPQKGADFYLEHHPKPGSHLVKMIKFVAEKGDFNETQKIIEKTFQRLEKDRDLSGQATLLVETLAIYRNFKKLELYFKNALALEAIHKKQPLEKSNLEQAINQITSLVGFLQVRLSKNNKINNTDYKPEKLQRIITYFNILTSLEPTKAFQHFYYQGETYFSVNLYEKAAKSYKDTLDFPSQKVSSQDEYRKKAINSLLSLLNLEVLDKKSTSEYTLYAYQIYLQFWPQGEKAQKIYPRLFNRYLNNKMIVKATAVFNKYLQYFPSDMANQRPLLSLILDAHIQSKNIAQLKLWNDRIQKGFLDFSVDFKKKTLVVLNQLIFQHNQELEKSGQSDKALIGYQQLFQSKEAPKNIQSKAALNSALIFLDQQNIELSYQWLLKYIDILDKDSIQDNLPQLMAFHEKFYLLQGFDESFKTSKLVIGLLCPKRFKNKLAVFQSHLSVAFMIHSYPMLQEIYQQAKQCQCSKKELQKMRIKIGQHLIEQELYSAFIDFYQQEKATKTSIFRKELSKMYWSFQLRQQKEVPVFINQELEKLNQFKDIQLIQKFETFSKEFGSSYPEMRSPSGKFDEKKFDNELEKSLANLGLITKQSKELLASRSPEIILGTYQILIQNYKNLAISLKTYTPTGFPLDYQNNFKKQIFPLINSLEKKAYSYQNQGHQFVLKNRLIGSHTSHFFQNYYEISPSLQKIYRGQELLTFDKTTHIRR